MDNSAKSSLQEALEIAAQILAGENAALLERISQLEQSVESMNEKLLTMQENLLQMQKGMPLMSESKGNVEVDDAHCIDDSFDVEEASVGEDESDLDEEAVDVPEEMEESIETPVEESIPDSMAGLGVLPFAKELMEKANEAAAGSDVFELMARNEETEEEASEDEIDDMLATDETDVDDVFRAISFNDRYEFIKELFNISGDLGEAEVLFKDTIDDINEMENFKQVVEYIRRRFPQWDEQSDEVYRFYMAIRRKFNKQ